MIYDDDFRLSIDEEIPDFIMVRSKYGVKILDYG